MQLRKAAGALALANVLLGIKAAAAATPVFLDSLTSCVDQNAINSCAATSANTFQLCESNCAGAVNHDDCILACACGYYFLALKCAYTSCWNQAYSCALQAMHVSYLVVCPISSGVIPFFPPPLTASAGCSCNLGAIYQANTVYVQEDATCGAKTFAAVAGATTVPNGECGCCEIAADISAVYEICPNTKPSLLLIDSTYSSFALAGFDFYGSKCRTAYSKYPCQSKLQFLPPIQNGVIYTPDNLPANGTNTLFNTGTLTAPVSGATFSYTMAGQVVTITAASAQAIATSASAAASSSTPSTAPATVATSGAVSSSTAGDVTTSSVTSSTGAVVGSAVASTTKAPAVMNASIGKGVQLVAAMCFAALYI